MLESISWRWNQFDWWGKSLKIIVNNFSLKIFKPVILFSTKPSCFWKGGWGLKKSSSRSKIQALFYLELNEAYNILCFVSFHGKPMLVGLCSFFTSRLQTFENSRVYLDLLRLEYIGCWLHKGGQINDLLGSQTWKWKCTKELFLQKIFCIMKICS